MFAPGPIRPEHAREQQGGVRQMSLRCALPSLRSLLRQHPAALGAFAQRLGGPEAHASASDGQSSAGLAAGMAAAFAFCGVPLVLADNQAPQRPAATPGQAQQQQPLTNHPLEFDPVTNEHTAQMTLARAAALDYYQAGKYAKAEAKFLEALAEAQLGFDAKDPHIASCKNNMAEFYRNTKQYAKAEKLYTEALDLLDLIYGEKHWLYVSTMHNLALMYEAVGKTKQAHDTMEHVTTLRLQMFGSRSFLYADSLFALAHITRKLGTKGCEQKSVKLMRDAIAILEDAESVQVSVILFWLEDLATQLRVVGKPAEAAVSIGKALHYMAGDKGEQLAQASSLSDSLVDCLLEARKLQDAKEAMQLCLGARMQLFQKDLAVVQSMAKLASIEAQLGQGSAIQNASNAAALARELLQEYSKGIGIGSWIKADAKANARTGLKRVQAGHLLGSSLKLLATLHMQLPDGRKAEGAEAALQEALVVLQGAAEQVILQLQQVAKEAPVSSASGSTSPAADNIEELSSQYVEVMLQRIECFDKLAELLVARGDKEAAKQLQQQCEEVAKQLVATS